MNQSTNATTSHQRRTTMIRKTVIAAAALAALGAAALAPTSASAWGFKHHHHWGHWGPGFGIGLVDVAPADCYFVERVNRFGVVKLIRVCN
jgi:hypothetical protein